MSDSFLGDRYLLSSDESAELYAAIAELPILDPHNHADVAEIRRNECYRDIWQAEADSDHYVWAALRSAGVEERFLTGDAEPLDKWRAACASWDDLAGNPTYEWVYLDFKRMLGIDDLLTAESADRVWEQANAVLARPESRPQELLKRMRVESMGSTDDPCDDLADHRALADDPNFPVKLLPTFRPDRLMHVYKDDWGDYVARLEDVHGEPLKSVADLRAALRVRHDYFAEHGCQASDHGMAVPFAHYVEDEDADRIFRRRREGELLSAAEEEAFSSWVLHEVAGLNAEKGWVFQLHMGVVRSVRDSLMDAYGADAGGDVSDNVFPVLEPLRDLLNRYDGKLKTVLYCLDPTYQPTLATLTRAFGQNCRLGAAWWFNDTPVGMRRQLEYVGGVDLLSNYAGMVSDSRKLLSYASRHEMFRRTLADVVGGMVVAGRVPMAAAERLVRKMVYDGVKDFWNV